MLMQPSTSPCVVANETDPARSATSSKASTSQLQLNLGCGPVQPPGWVNVDGSNRAWIVARLSFLDRFLVALRLFPPTEFKTGLYPFNLKRRFPWPDGSVHAIYMGELLEHFTPEEGERILKECLRVLEPGGTLRIRVPDNATFWSNYLVEFNRAKQLPRSEWTLGHTRWIQMFFHDICVRRPWFGTMGHFHKWMYDEVSLIQLMENIGFREVNRMTLHQSRIADVAAVEVRDDLIVEGIK